MWSKRQATEGEVSDVYVRLGYEFNIACRAFNAIGVDTQDLGPVPDMLRTILEETLSQEASQQSLEKYLPKIRDIIINLLHGLKKKQQKLRQRSGKEGESTRPTRQASTMSTASVDSGTTLQPDEIPSRHTSSKSYLQSQNSGDVASIELPPRTASAGGRTSPHRQGISPKTSVADAQTHRETLNLDSGSSLSSNALQNVPIITPYPETDTMPSNQSAEPDYDRLTPEPQRQPPKANDALTALQRGGDLERRASRRFSTYQIQKHLGGPMNSISTMPPVQTSPIPNRGQDRLESMNAVRSRGSFMQMRSRSRNNRDGMEVSPNRIHEVRRISEEKETISQQDDAPIPIKPDNSGDGLDSPHIQTPEDKLGGYQFPNSPAGNQIGATLNGPLDEPFVHMVEKPTSDPQNRIQTSQSASTRLTKERTPPASQFIPDGSPRAGKELTIFLQYKSKIKKFVLPDGGDLSIPRLQLAFIEKFAWNTHNNGVDLPEIYIQDPVSGVRHELEDLNDIKERSVLVLNVEALDEVKRHFDDGIGGLRRMVEGVRTSVEDQNSALQRVSDRQQETARELASLAAAPPPAPVTQVAGATISPGKGLSSQLKEVQTLRRDLAVVRQAYSSFVSDMTASMSAVRSKATEVKKVAANAVIPDMDSNSGRAYVNTGKKSLSQDSENIVNRVDDLQDVVEDLRKDVVSRGVRPLPRQLETVSKDISVATFELKKLQDFLKREKPIWTKIWEKELQVVCDDRDLLTMQEELAADLEDDLEKAAATFALVEQATKQQNLQTTARPGQALRSTSKTLIPHAVDQGADPYKAKDSVLGEVRALQPNHESRLEAIERAERARQRELESRQGNEFTRELGSFVEEGRLKKSGGVEEVERMRKLREEETRLEIFERQKERARLMAEKEDAAAAAADAAQNENEAQPEAISNHTVEAEGGVNGDDTTLDVSISTYEGERESSPEPIFVEANEEVGTTSNGTSL